MSLSFVNHACNSSWLAVLKQFNAKFLSNPQKWNHDDVLDFVAGHDTIFVVEQNRDAQLRTLLISEGDLDPARLVPILHYDGTPITARFIVKAIADMLAVVTLAPLKKALP